MQHHHTLIQPPKKPPHQSIFFNRPYLDFCRNKKNRNKKFANVQHLLASSGLLCTCASTLAFKGMRFSTLLQPDRMKCPEKYT